MREKTRDILIQGKVIAMRKRRVLIFEDDGTILMLLSSFFSKMGYEVFAYPEPIDCPLYSEGAEYCVKNEPCADLLITDYRMPKMNGTELLQVQHQRGCKLDIRNKALISGFLDEEIEALAKEMGCRVFKKPFDLSELSTWVSECETRVDISQPLGIISGAPGG